MIETQLNLFDAAVLGVMALSCVLAFFRGFVREILSLGAWIGAGIVTLYYFPQVAEALQPKFKSAVIAAGFATLGIYIAALIGFSIVNMIILRFVKSGSDVGLLDNSLGLIFGAFRGALLIGVAFFLMTIVLPEDDYPVWITKSVSLPFVKEAAIVVAKVSPAYLRDISSLKKTVKEDTEDSEDKNAWERGKDAEKDAMKRMKENYAR
jgi:membrane protein required for colicin V production